MKKNVLRELPKVDALTEKALTAMELPERARTLLTEAVREVIEALRASVLQEGAPCLPDEEAILSMVREAYAKKTQRSLRPVINATGIALHTNLGRSVLSREAADAAWEVACSYNTLEYALAEGRRGSRYAHVEGLLRELTGAEAAMVVNNNAAAVMLILGTMAKGGSVVISRGELVEIGGSFRVPEIMEMSGATLLEVGTTNKTHPKDYARAIREDTAALLKVHTSNFKMIGFTEEVELSELVELGRTHSVPVIYDMGSGSMLSMRHIRGVQEPNVIEAVQSGADVLCFSGDKLLGGPQAGIIVGRKAYIDAMKANPLTRALRVDKMTMAALEVTLRQYLEGNAEDSIPTLRMLGMTMEQLEARYLKLDALLKTLPRFIRSEQRDEAPAGGGSLPGVMLPSLCMAIALPGVSTDELEKSLRELPRPIIARIHNDKLLLDMRTIAPGELEAVKEGLMRIEKRFEARK